MTLEADIVQDRRPNLGIIEPILAVAQRES